jgi:rod shape-determining protein MreC
MFFGSLTFEDVRDHILAAVLVLTGTFLMVSRDEGGLKTIRTVSITAASYLEQPLSAFRHYRTALATNQELQRQNILLNDELSRLRSAQRELEALQAMLGLQQKSPIPMKAVTVIGKSITGLGSSITVDAGAADSIQAGMPFITANGLVGTVTMSSNRFAQVLPYIHPMFRASARIQGSRAYGIVSYSGSGENLMMNYVTLTVEVPVGALVETSGYSYSYPPGVPIGRVVSARPEPGKDYQIVTVEPFQRLGDLSEGFILYFKPDTALVRLSKDFESYSK